MNKIIRWYNQNRQMIWTAITVITGVILLIQALNNYYKNNKTEESSSTNISTTTYNKPNYSVVTKTEINKNTSESTQTIIKNFFDYCNNGKIENAYNLLSEDCKQKLYPTIEEFKEKYYNRIFTEYRSYNGTLWISKENKNTYRLEITGDILATGKKEDMPIEDYYTVIEKDGDYSLSINSYIEKVEMNISKAQENITITILNKHIYMGHEIYEIKVKNNSQRNITLNTKDNADSIYIEDENGLKYIAFLNEISSYDLQISRGLTKTYNIKFDRTYKPNINIERIVFEDIKFGQQNELNKIEIDI